MPKIRIPRDVLQRALWPGEEYRVRIVGADMSGGDVVFDIEGDGLPECEYVRRLVLTRSETRFSKA